MFRKQFATTVICFIALAYSKVEVSAKTEKDLWRHLFEGQEYDKLFRPVKNASTAVPVSVGLAPFHITQQKHPYIRFYEVGMWLIVEWKDEYLTWDPKDFDNIEQLILPVSKVWSPKLSSYPGQFKFSLLTNKTNDVVIRFDGTVSWMTTNSVLGKYIVPDKGDSYLLISIISWTHDDSQMTIDINNKVNENMTGASLKTSKELIGLSWSKKYHSIIHFALGKI